MVIKTIIMPGKCKNTKYTKYRWDKKQQKCVVRKKTGVYDFEIDGKKVNVEATIKTTKKGEEKKPKPTRRSGYRKMFRIIDRNTRKGITG